MRATAILPCAAACLLLWSCASSPEVVTDAGGGGPAADAGSQMDAGASQDASIPDAGLTSFDAGSPMDAGSGDAGCSGYVTVAAGNERSERFSSICDGSWGSQAATTAIAYLYQGGPPPGEHNLIIEGCSSAAAQSAGIQLSLFQDNGVGSYPNGSLTFTDDSGITWSSSGGPFSASITLYGAPGGAVEGTFSSTAFDAADAGETVAGSFHVCRVADEDTP